MAAKLNPTALRPLTLDMASSYSSIEALLTMTTADAACTQSLLFYRTIRRRGGSPRAMEVDNILNLDTVLSSNSKHLNSET